MTIAELKAEGFKEIEEEIIELATSTFPKESRQFMAKEGNKLKKNLKAALKNGYKKKTGNLIHKDYLKRGKVYVYKPLNSYEVRIHFAPHTHLLEYGFKHVKSGRRIEGRKLVTKEKAKFADIYERDAEEFIDDITKGW